MILSSFCYAGTTITFSGSDGSISNTAYTGQGVSGISNGYIYIHNLEMASASEKDSIVITFTTLQSHVSIELIHIQSANNGPTSFSARSGSGGTGTNLGTVTASTDGTTMDINIGSNSIKSVVINKCYDGTNSRDYNTLFFDSITTVELTTTTTTLSTSLNPSFTSDPNNSVTLTADVTSGATGTVTFKDGANTLSGGNAVTLSGGIARLTCLFTTEGLHDLTAIYSGDINYSTSTSSTLYEVVNNHTTINGSNFSNNGAITITDNSAANPYPSNIFVSGLTGNISAVTLTINNFSTNNPSDLDILLAGPNGKFVIMNSAGGSSTVNGVNITFSDAAGSYLPSAFSSGSYKPTSNGSLNSIQTPYNPFYSPSGTYSSPAPYGTGTFSSVFSGTDPNGTWNLYVYDDSASGAGSIAGGWNLNFNTTSLPVELTSFSASSNSNVVNLIWNTATEVNNYGFEIQRSVGQISNLSPVWTKIGFVKGSGNSNSPKNYSFVDNNPDQSGTVKYRLKQIDNDGNFKYSSIVTVNLLPTKFELYQNYPNPFNPTTAISYQLSTNSHVTLKLYDVLGREVATLVDKEQNAGRYSVELSADKYQLASGVYFYRITAGNYTAVKKLLLLK